MIVHHRGWVMAARPASQCCIYGVDTRGASVEERLSEAAGRRARSTATAVDNGASRAGTEGSQGIGELVRAAQRAARCIARQR